MLPNLYFSQRIFSFGNVAIGSKSYGQFEINNLNSLIPLNIKFTKGIHFEIKPSSLKL